MVENMWLDYFGEMSVGGIAFESFAKVSSGNVTGVQTCALPIYPLQYSCLENPWMEGPGGLQSMASLRVRHD